MSEAYLRAIAALAQEIYESGFFLTFQGCIDWADPWMQFCHDKKLLPILRSVEDRLSYELSWNQCCIAIQWIFKYSPQAWSHLL